HPEPRGVVERGGSRGEAFVLFDPRPLAIAEHDHMASASGTDALAVHVRRRMDGAVVGGEGNHLVVALLADHRGPSRRALGRDRDQESIGAVAGAERATAEAHLGDRGIDVCAECSPYDREVHSSRPLESNFAATHCFCACPTNSVAPSGAIASAMVRTPPILRIQLTSPPASVRSRKVPGPSRAADPAISLAPADSPARAR